MDNVLPEEERQQKPSLLFLSKKLVSVLCLCMSILLILFSFGVQALIKEKSLNQHVRISEIMSGNGHSLLDATGKTPDWIELYNPSSKDFNLKSYILTDSMEDLNKFVFPDIIVPANDYLLLYAGDTKGMVEGICSTGFKLSKEGETLYLVSPNDDIVQTLTVPSLNTDVSYALRQNGSYGYCGKSTPGKANVDDEIQDSMPDITSESQSPADEVEQVKSGGTFNANGVYINEVCAANAVKSGDKDWIELYNGSNEAVDLTGYTLSDDTNVPNKWTFPSFRVEAKSYAVIEASSNESERDEKTATFGISPKGETLVLRNVKGEIVDVFDTGVLKAGVTSGRNIKDGAVQRAFFHTPTKGKQNAEQTFTGYTNRPEFSVNDLYHTNEFSLSLVSISKDAIIYYTTDGSEPGIHSKVYSEPIPIKTNTAIRAVAYADGLIESETVSHTYLFDVPHTVPAVCISGKASQMRTILDSDKSGYKPEYPTSTEYYEADGTLGVSFPSGLRPKGKSSLALAQNSLTIALRSGYGQQSVTYRFFPNGSPDTFSNLTLRSSGQDNPDAKIRDPFFHAVCNGINVDSLQTRPVAVYINGSYCGLYDLCEEQNEDYLESHYGVDSDKIDLVNHKVTQTVGDTEEYKRVVDCARTWDLSDDGKFAEFSQLVDVDACTDFLVAQIYFGNGDVSNNRFWRATDYSVKWRPLLFDLDYCLRYNDENRNVFDKYLVARPSIGKTYEGNNITTEMYIFSGLMKNKAWRNKFVERFVQLTFTQFDTQRILKIYDDMVVAMKPEMQAQIQRWHVPSSMSRWESEVNKLRDALEERQSIVLKQLQRYFNVSDASMQEYIQKYSTAQ